MTLARWRRNCPDALTADLIQTYGFDVLNVEDVRLIALLAAQLPRNARVRVNDNPDAAWSVETFLIREIEYSLRAWIWGNSDPGKRGVEPKPQPSPLEAKLAKADLENKKTRVSRAKSILGIE